MALLALLRCRRLQAGLTEQRVEVDRAVGRSARRACVRCGELQRRDAPPVRRGRRRGRGGQRHRLGAGQRSPARAAGWPRRRHAGCRVVDWATSPLGRSGVRATMRGTSIGPSGTGCAGARTAGATADAAAADCGAGAAPVRQPAPLRRRGTGAAATRQRRRRRSGAAARRARCRRGSCRPRPTASGRRRRWSPPARAAPTAAEGPAVRRRPRRCRRRWAAIRRSRHRPRPVHRTPSAGAGGAGGAA